MTELTTIEELKARLHICRQQLDCNSVINTSRRKDALRMEIQQIEEQLAKALGIHDDNEDASEDESSTDSPESTHLPSIHSPSRSHSPSPSAYSPFNDSKLKTENTWTITPPNWSHTFDTGSSSTATTAHKSEVESVRSALVDAGEEALDIEELLREQEMMEQRLADMKRKREEEDEAFARTIQEEEYQRPSRPNPFSNPRPQAQRTQPHLQARLDRARQERMDAEMARIFDESESTSSRFNLAGPTVEASSSSASSRPPYFSIFDKRVKREETAAGPSRIPGITATFGAPSQSGSSIPGTNNSITTSVSIFATTSGNSGFTPSNISLAGPNIGTPTFFPSAIPFPEPTTNSFGIDSTPAPFTATATNSVGINSMNSPFAGTTVNSFGINSAATSFTETNTNSFRTSSTPAPFTGTTANSFGISFTPAPYTGTTANSFSSTPAPYTGTTANSFNSMPAPYTGTTTNSFRSTPAPYTGTAANSFSSTPAPYTGTTTNSFNSMPAPYTGTTTNSFRSTPAPYTGTAANSFSSTPAPYTGTTTNSFSSTPAPYTGTTTNSFSSTPAPYTGTTTNSFSSTPAPFTGTTANSFNSTPAPFTGTTANSFSSTPAPFTGTTTSASGYIPTAVASWGPITDGLKQPTPCTFGHGFTIAPHLLTGASNNPIPNPTEGIMAPAAGSSHQYTILATQPAAGSGSQSQPQKTVDLTQPVIDLTQQHQVYEILDSDEEDMNATSSSFSMSYGHFSHANVPFMTRENSSLYWSHDDDDDEDDDEENDEELLKALQKWEQPSYTNTSHSWGQDSTRNMEPGQSEKELRDLLANIQASEEDVAPQDRTGTPEGMASHILLLEHQKIGLTWLQKMEDGTNRGGILGDDMGLGKTVQTIALIASRPSPPIDDPVMWDNSQVFHSPPAEALLVKTKATLVVAPVSLVYQWAEELRTKTQPGLLKVYVYHGNNKSSNPEHLRRYDVVVTSVTTLTMDAGHVDAGNPRKSRTIGALFKAHFHRVVIDEAHVIKNRTTKSSKACALISATYRWCLTGTPVQNNVDELYSLIRVLRIKPYCDWDEFRNKISTPMKRTRQYGPAMQRVQALLKAVCLRRTKKCTVDGKPILDLPERNVHMVSTPFTDDERAFYTALEHRTRDRFNAYVRAGTVMKNYSNILVLLLRLRQACCHPHLINDFEKVQDTDAPAEEKARVDRLLDNLLDDIRRRLIERDADAVECPICMDVGEESVILSGCGHIYCRACITAHLSRHDDEDRKCPECRRPAPIDNLISVADFNARYCPVAEPEPEPEDVKGKGKALDDGDDANDLDKLPKIVVPDVLEDWLSSSKVDKLIEIVQAVTAKKEKIIVFSQFTSLLTLIERPLNAENIKYLRYDGSMSLDTRNDAVQRLIEDPDYSVMLISLKCGSLGLNLTVANHVVIMDPWWNPALENQAIDRVHRIGQTKDVHVHRLCIPETVEDRILALQARKQALADGALGEGKVPKLAKLGLQELMFLFRGA